MAFKENEIRDVEFHSPEDVLNYANKILQTKPNQLSVDQMLELDDAATKISQTTGVPAMCANCEKAKNAVNLVMDSYKIQLQQEKLYRHV